jgi:hypothetical protein
MIPGLSSTSWSQLSRNPRYAIVLTLGLIFIVLLTFSAWRRHDTVDYIEGRLCSVSVMGQVADTHCVHPFLADHGPKQRIVDPYFGPFILSLPCHARDPRISGRCC